MNWKFPVLRLRCNLTNQWVDSMNAMIEKTGRLTEQEIAEAILAVAGEGLKTNATAVRKHLGRGSNDTIQKVLNKMKEEARAACRIKQNDELPDMPQDEMQALWRAAATVALRGSFERLARLQTERDEALEKLTDSSAELNSANVQIDDMRDEIWRKSEEAAQAAAVFAGDIASLKAEIQRKDDECSLKINASNESIAVLEDQLMRMRNAMELERSKFEVERGTLERLNERQVAQLVEYKGLVERLASKADSVGVDVGSSLMGA